MEVILKEDIEKLGQRGDVVKVADGYGRNFLLPRRLAIQATKGNKKVVEDMKSASVRKSAKDKAAAEQLSVLLADVSLSFARKTGAGDQLFGSVTSADIADALHAKGFNIDRRKVHLDDPIKSLGEFTVPIKLFREVTGRVSVVVTKDAGE